MRLFIAALLTLSAGSTGARAAGKHYVLKATPDTVAWGWLDPKQDLFVILLIQRVGLGNSDASKMRQALQEPAVAAVK